MNYNEGATRDGGKRKERPPSLTLSSQEHGGTQGASDHPRPSLGSINSHSSLDPYYFTATIARPVISSTPEPRPEPNIPPTSSYGDIEPAQEPKTPATHPGSIDRAGLVGVGDLTTPRWTSRTDASSRNHPWRSLDFDLVPPKEDSEPLAPQGAQEQDNDVDRSSPWTIEAVDESDTNEMPSYIVPSPPPVPPAMAPPSPAPKFTDPAGEFRALRARRSVEENPGEKSAGEEILYPRTVSKSRPGTEPSTPMVLSDAAKSSTSGRGHLSAREARRSPTLTSGGTPASSSTPHRHRKRPSEEISPSGSTGRANGSSSSSKDETSVRRHRSLGVAPPGGSPVIGREKAKERRRQDVANSMISPSRGHSSKDSISKERHVRRSSASAASTSSPPSQETTFNKRAHDFSHLPPSPSSTTLQHILKSTTVNHTGTPSPLPTHATVPSLDDSATAEALRKLDGISGKNLRARSSVISVASKSSSRPGTPGSKTGHGQWEGVEAPPLTKRRSVGANLRDATPASSSGQTTVAPTPAAVPIMPQEKEDADLDMTIIKASNTPIGAKLKRSNSTGSDSSSIHSEKDRAAALAAGADGEPTSIPPVPPLPKAYQTPPGSAHQHSVNSYNGHFLQEDPADHLHGQPEVEAHALPKRLTPAAEQEMELLWA
ncbi:hypothetical protein PIIN_04153 [Serendipita indica DSM 11827]|uniref:Uncharacterized protein n=1 Tax=Serendipita indica (strain DSM 11827) TaxID=1109443 RepID=G4TFW2_SERID|nr:hypothetical protein PIIN_04153 [Serendipita indica DSM 11827]